MAARVLKVWYIHGGAYVHIQYVAAVSSSSSGTAVVAECVLAVCIDHGGESFVGVVHSRRYKHVVIIVKVQQTAILCALLVFLIVYNER